jgi:hypothetical protein
MSLSLVFPFYFYIFYLISVVYVLLLFLLVLGGRGQVNTGTSIAEEKFKSIHSVMRKFVHLQFISNKL